MELSECMQRPHFLPPHVLPGGPASSGGCRGERSRPPPRLRLGVGEGAPCRARVLRLEEPTQPLPAVPAGDGSPEACGAEGEAGKGTGTRGAKGRRLAARP